MITGVDLQKVVLRILSFSESEPALSLSKSGYLIFNLCGSCAICGITKQSPQGKAYCREFVISPCLRGYLIFNLCCSCAICGITKQSPGGKSVLPRIRYFSVSPWLFNI
jgi:hypothetical protein